MKKMVFCPTPTPYATLNKELWWFTKFEAGQVWVFKKELHHKGLTKPKIELHIVEGRALSVVAAQQCYDLKPKDDHL
jgi:hypothetical protein